VIIFRFIRLFFSAFLFLLLAGSSGVANGQGGAGAAPQDAALGRWRLSPGLSRFLSPKDHVTSMTRTYERDGDKIKETWSGSGPGGKSLSGFYSAKCDGTQEQSGEVQVTCTRVSHRRVDGEIIFSRDPDHRYYTRQVMPDNKMMKIIWYKDADRKKWTEILVFNRAG
jgi:hypothetical protein